MEVGSAAVASVTLPSTDLVDKFGFSDGDLCQQWVESWAASAWPAQLTGALDDADDPVWSYVSGSRLLVHLVDTYLAPALPVEFAQRVTAITSVHNPVRLCAPDGVDEAMWEIDFIASVQDFAVTVGQAAVESACSELFPERDAGWLQLHHSLTWEVNLMLALKTARLKLWTDPAIHLTDALYAELGGDGSRLLAEMLSSRERTLSHNDALDLAELAELSKVVQACCRS